ncbi:MAG TPA: molybdopterin-dependent oxidoreductase, partial [Casimicrobiaceae bacterium]|nr:molybdopterin-dependent oxidoreductase [Casimicrobiaceae bacterium]
RALVIGSFLRKDHPLLAHRLRQAAKKGAQISSLHSVDDDWLMPVAHRAIVPPSLLPMMLAEIVVAAAQGAGSELPRALAGIEPTAGAEVIAASLLTGERRAILLGNYAVQHPEASQIAALARALASITGASLGVLTEAANTVGGHVAGALPQRGGRNARAMLGGGGDEPRRAYVVLHADPEFDCANPVAARAALQKAEFVVVMSPFRHGMKYADALLPIAPFTETSGTFVNCEGRVQGFHGVATPAGESRPGWKLLRVLGTMLKLDGFEFETSEEIRDAVVAQSGDLAARLSSGTRTPIVAPATSAATVERVADVPIHFADPLARRAPALQQTADARPPRARLNRTLLDALGIAEGAQIKVRQGAGEAVLATQVDPAVPPGVVRIAAAHPSTCGLEGLSGPVTVERA